MSAGTNIRRIREVCAYDALCIDGGSPHATLPHALMPAALVHALAHTDLDLAVGLLKFIPYVPARAEAILAIAQRHLTQAPRIAVESPLHDLLEAALALPSQSDFLAYKAYTLTRLLPLVTPCDMPNAVGPGEVAKAALQAAAGSADSSLCGWVVGTAARSPEAARDTTALHLAQRFVGALRIYDLMVQRDLPYLLLERAQREVPATNSIETVMTETVDWFHRAVLEVFLGERDHVLHVLTESLRHTPELGDCDRELADALSDGSATSMILLAADQRARANARRAGTLRHLDKLACDEWRELLEARRARMRIAPALALGFGQDLGGAFFETWQQLDQRLETSFTAARLGLTTGGEPAPPFQLAQHLAASHPLVLTRASQHAPSDPAPALWRLLARGADAREVSTAAGSASPIRPARSHGPALDEFIDACQGPQAHRIWATAPRDLVAQACQSFVDEPVIGGRVLSLVARIQSLAITNTGGTRGHLAEAMLAIVRAAPAWPRQATRSQETAAPEPDATAWGPLDCPDRLHAQVGRTLVFRTTAGLRAFKLQRQDEPLSALHAEYWALIAKRQQHTCSSLPEPKGVGSCGAAQAWRDTVRTAGIELANPLHGFVYESAEAGYWHYVNDVSPAACEEGVRRAITDLVAWLLAGEVFTALTVKNHNTSEPGDRGYVWMIDACRQPEARLGMGRLDRVERLCTYPNVRSTGIADLAELAPLNRVISAIEHRRENGKPALEPLSHLFAPPADRRKLYGLFYLGDYLLDLTLLLADARRRRGALTLTAEDIGDLGAQLLRLWLTAASAFTGLQAERLHAPLAAIINFERMARQLATFLEPRHFAAAFDRTVRIEEHQVRRSIKRTATRIENEATTLAEVLRRDLYGDVRVTIDLSGAPKRWLRPGEAKGTIMGFSCDGESLDLGPFNGPWLQLELERALYLIPALLLHWRQ